MSIFNRGTSIIVQEGSDLSVQLAIDAELGAREAEAAAAASAASAASAAATAADEAIAEAAAGIAADVAAAAASATAANADATATAADRVAVEAVEARINLGDLDAAVAATAADAVQTAADVVAAQAAQTAAGTARTGAETARDAAFVNADVYADTAAGLAATAVGDQFQVIAGDEVIRYRHDAGPVAVEVARYPSVSGARKVRDIALTKFYSIIDLATAKAAPLFLIHPDLCFVERSVSATTKSGLGGLVGCVKSPDGAYFAISTADANRPTLRQDAAGNYYLLATGANLVITNPNGTRWDPTTAWTHIGGWQGVGTAFCWFRGPATSNRLNLGETPFLGNISSITRAADNSTARVFQATQDAMSVPFVLRVVKSLSDISAYYNDNPKRREAATVVPDDDSARTREIGLFMNVSGANAANFSGGLFYGGLWLAGTLTDEETRFATAEMMRLTIPRETTHYVDPNPVILDFANSVFSWGGETRAITDLTDNGGGSYTLNDMRWWTQEHTVIVDVLSDLAAGSWSGTFLEFASANRANEKVSVHTSNAERRVAYAGPSQSLLLPFVAPFAGTAGDPSRFAFVVKPGGVVKAYTEGGLPDGEDYEAFAMIPPTSLTVDTAVTGWTLSRVAIYPKALEGDALWDAMAQEYDTHVLGDSFTIFHSTKFQSPVYDLVAAGGNPEVVFSTDGVGGVAFYEANGNGHTQRFALTPQHWRKTLIINDGGFEYSRGEVLIRNGIADLIRCLDHADNAKRYVYLEPNPINPVGDVRNTDWQTATGWVKDMTGTHYVDTLEAMFSANDGSANDATDVANGIWPRSTRVDSTHYTVAGQAIYAKAAHGAMVDLGYYPGTTALPGAVQSLIATGSVITWAAPADDGGHPVLGYIVQRNTGTWVTQDPQGSATGYTKQYIREWTAPAAGTYRVAAITRKGTGAYTEVVVA